MSMSTKQQKRMSLLAKMQKKKALQLQRGEMPIGPILIIALIVIPLVIILVVFGGEIAENFNTKADAVLEADGNIER